MAAPENLAIGTLRSSLKQQRHTSEHFPTAHCGDYLLEMVDMEHDERCDFKSVRRDQLGLYGL